MSWVVDIHSIEPPAPAWDDCSQNKDCNNQPFPKNDRLTSYKRRKKYSEDSYPRRHLNDCYSTESEEISQEMCSFDQLSKTVINQSFIKKAECKLEKRLEACQVCHVTLSTPEKIHIHQEEFVRIFKCCKCMKVLGNKQKLESHHRTHTKEKPFQCRFCEKVFSECSSLRKHLLTHGPPGFKCSYCWRQFKRKDYMLKHMKSQKCENYLSSITSAS